MNKTSSTYSNCTLDGDHLPAVQQQQHRLHQRIRQGEPSLHIIHDSDQLVIWKTCAQVKVKKKKSALTM